MGYRRVYRKLKNMPPPRKKLKSPVENQRKITFFLGQTDESNQDSTKDRIAKFASTIQTMGTRCTNFMGRWLTFCAISALKENLHVPFPFLM
jgi:hypothetical protein